MMCHLVMNGQQIQPSEGGEFLLKNGQVYDHEEGLMKADLYIKDGMIEAVGTALVFPEAKEIDCEGLDIYPGMIDLSLIHI